jgi:hypothetical protein
MDTIDFVTESNRIEGILRPPTDAELHEHERFVAQDEITIAQLERFVAVYQPDVILRDRPGLNVRVGNHFPPIGGPQIREELDGILKSIGRQTPYQVHVAYETIHPFTDGNGRSGRTLWAWQMEQLYGGCRLGFLHQFYYQALDGARKP